ncbi:hypothetical protein ACFLYV_03395 [Chloroflexota bacterium]
MNIYRKGYFWFVMMIVVFALVMILDSFNYSEEARLVPILVGVSALLMCAMLFLGEKYPRIASWFDVSLTDLVKTDPGGVASRLKAGEGDGGSAPTKKVLASFAWLIGLYVSIFLIGFLVAVPVYTFLYLKIGWRIKLVNSSAVTIGIGAIIYGGFEVAMRADLYKGIVFGAILPPL